MSWGLSSAMNVATSSMLAKQKQLSIVSTNVANVDNQYYHRRSANLESIDLAGGGTYGGTGVYLAAVYRSYDASLESSLKTALSNNAYQDEYLSRLTELESLLGPNGTNYLADSLSTFAAGLQEVANNPTSITARSALLSYGRALSSEFDQEYSNMVALRDAIASNDASGSGHLATQVSEVNTLLDQIVALNKSILTLEENDFTNQSALDLRDQRDQLVKELAVYIDVNVSEEANGQYTVELNVESGAAPVLIDGTVTPQPDASHLAIAMAENPAGSGFYEPSISVVAPDGTTTAVTLNADSGSIRALLDGREYICDQMTNLYEFASALAAQINTLQNDAGSYDLNNNSAQGNFFYCPATQPTSGSILSLASYIDGNPRLIAAADAAGQDGNGNIATAMFELLNTDGLYKSESLMSYSDRILSNVAQEVSEAKTLSETTANVVIMFQSAVNERSAVSMDEEMVSMLELQRAYQASAKMITTIDEMVQTVLNMV